MNPEVNSTHQLFGGSPYAAEWLLHLQVLGALPLKPVATLAGKPKSACLNPCSFSLFRGWQASRSWHGFPVSSVGKIPKCCYCSLAGTFFQCCIYFQWEAINLMLQHWNKQFVLVRVCQAGKVGCFSSLVFLGELVEGKSLAQEPQNPATAFLSLSASLKKVLLD